MIKGISLFYFFLGLILQLPELAVRFYLIDLGIEPSVLGAFQATLVIPWCAKPVYGFISDALPLCGRRRQPYIILCNLMAALAWTLMSTMTNEVWAAQVLLVLASVMTCFADVMYDSILVELAKKEDEHDHGKIQSWCWGSRAAGALVAAFMGGIALRYVTPQKVFVAEAVLLCFVALCGYCLIDERKNVHQVVRCGHQCSHIFRTFKHPFLWKPAVFVFVFAATPSSYTAFFYFLVNELHFSSSFLGIMTCVRHAAMMLGTYLYSRCFRHTNYRSFFFWTVLFSAVLGASPIILVTHTNMQMGLPNGFFALGDDVFLSVLGQIALMPCLVLVAKLCPQGIEASLYASFVSILNFAGIVSEYGGALATHLAGVTKDDFTNLPYLMLGCTLSSLLPIAFLTFLPRGNVRDVVSQPSDEDDEVELVTI